MAISGDVKINLAGLKDLGKNLPKFRNDLVRKTAKETPKNIIRNILLQRAGLNDLKALPVNATSTINRKRSRGKPALSLIDDLKLTNIKTWFTKRVGKMYKVGLRSSRQRIAFYLHKGIRSNSGKRKYEFMLKPKKHVPVWLAVLIKRENFRFFSKYV